jgi:hypothetical protein
LASDIPVEYLQPDALYDIPEEATEDKFEEKCTRATQEAVSTLYA